MGIGDVGREVWDGVRSLWRRPGTSLPVVATLALGLGLLSAVFAVADAVLFRPLPFSEPEGLLEVVTGYRGGGWTPDVPPGVGRELLREAGPERAALYARRELVRTGSGDAETVVGWAATPGLFGILGVSPALGRSLTPADRGGDRILLTNGYWRRSLGADPAVVGATLRLDGRGYTVVGVLPPAMDRFPHVSGGSDLWLPMDVEEGATDDSGPAPSFVVRVQPGGSPEVWAERITAREDGFRDRGLLPQTASLRVQRLGSWRMTTGGEAAIRLVGVAALVLLLVTVLNSGTLLLLETRRRAGEWALRLALGAGWTRLARAALIRSAVLGLVAGTAAVAMAVSAVPLVRAVLPRYFLRFSAHAVEAGPRLLLFTGLAAVAVSLSLGMAHAGVVARGAGRGRRPGSVRAPERGNRAREAMVVAQVALSATLLVGAGLLGRSMVRIAGVDPGFEVEGRWVLTLDARGATGGAPGSEEDLADARRLREAVLGLPGVASVALADAAPPTPSVEFPLALEPAGGEPPVRQPPFLPYLAGDAALFDVLGVEVVEGRALRSSDPGTGNVVVDRDLARLLWAGESAVGRSFRTGGGAPWLTVVGVVDDLKLMGWDESQARVAMIRPLEADALSRGVTVIALNRPGAGLVPPPAARRAARDIFPDQPVRAMSSLEEAMATSAEQPFFFTVLLAVLTGCALVLAALGLYAVVSASVQDRRRELGVRMAVGASASAVRGWVLRRALLLAGAGIVAGAGAGWLGSGLLRSLLYGVGPGDPLTLVAVAAVLLTISGGAALVPAVRASRLDPARILRAEG